MSLPALALRVLATQALRGQTFCGDNVLDSPQNPIDTIERGPTITIYTGESHGQEKASSLAEVQWKVDFSFHMHLPNEVTAGDMVLDVRSGGGEAAFDILWRQILRALLVEDNKWAKLWRDTVVSVDSIQSRPFMIELDKGIRIQAREVIFSVEVALEPQFGPILSGSWWDNFVQALIGDASPELQQMGALIKAETESPTGITDYRALQAMLGLNDAAFAGIGLAPAALPSPPVTTIVVSNGDGEDSTINSSTPLVP